jgi:hypothetical protein
MFPIIMDKNVKPIIITNPIYIGQSGDGKFTLQKQHKQIQGFPAEHLILK